MSDTNAGSVAKSNEHEEFGSGSPFYNNYCVCTAKYVCFKTGC